MNRKIVLAIVVLASSVFLSVVGVASAQSFRTGTNVALPQKDVINQTVYVAAQNVDIASEVFGDVFCVGQTVTVSGTVHGDVICAGQTVTVSGKVDGDVRLAGQTVVLESAIQGNASIGGQTFTLSSKGSVAGDASIGSSIANINGTIGRDLAVGSESIVINSAVGRNIQAATNSLELSANARVAGNIDYTSDSKLIAKNGATIGGKVTLTAPKKESSKKNGAMFGIAIGWFIYVVVALLLVSFTLSMLFPSLLKRVTDEAYPTPWKALLVGGVAGVLSPVVIILVGITIIGIPLALLIGLSWALILTLSGPLAGFYLGRRILTNSNSIPVIMLVGGSILLVSYFIPLVGFITLLLAAWLGSGMQILAIRSRVPRPNYELQPPKKTKKK